MVEDLILENSPRDTLKVVKTSCTPSVRDLGDSGGSSRSCHLTKNTEILTEFVRQRLARYISSRLKAEDGQIHVLTVDGALEEAFRGQIQQIDGDFHLGVAPHVAEQLLIQLEEQMNQMSMMGLVPVLLVSPELRRPVRNLIERFLPQMMVISHKEVAHGIQVTTRDRRRTRRNDQSSSRSRRAVNSWSPRPSAKHGPIGWIKRPHPSSPLCSP